MAVSGTAVSTAAVTVIGRERGTFGELYVRDRRGAGGHGDDLRGRRELGVSDGEDVITERDRHKRELATRIGRDGLHPLGSGRLQRDLRLSDGDVL